GSVALGVAGLGSGVVHYGAVAEEDGHQAGHLDDLDRHPGSVGPRPQAVGERLGGGGQAGVGRLGELLVAGCGRMGTAGDDRGQLDLTIEAAAAAFSEVA
ncbi:MAG: hypothetical protein ACKOTA_04365, partial [Solirubrobacterales bacterium]